MVTITRNKWGVAMSGHSRFLQIVLVACLLSATPLRVQAVADPHVAFSKLAAFNGISLAPDGKKAVALRAMQDTYHVIVLDFDKGTSKLLMVADPEQFLFNWCRFANNTRIVCSIRSYTVRLSARGGKYLDGRTIATRLIAIDVDGSNRLQLVSEKKTGPGQKLSWNALRQDQIISWLPKEPDHVLLALSREDRIYPTVYKLNVKTNKLKKARKFRQGVFQWSADAAGTVRNGWGLNRGKRTAYFGRQENGDLRPLDLSALEGELALAAHAYTQDGGVIVSAYNGKSTQGLYELDSATGAVKEALFHDPDYDTWSALLHPKTSQLVAVRTPYAESSYRWFDTKLGDEYNALRASLPGKPSRLTILSTDDTLNRFVVKSEGNFSHPGYYMYDRNSKSVVALAKDFSAVPSAELTEKQAVSYQARDGLTIPAYLSLPRSGPARSLPTIIFPHGGPWARDFNGFDYWVQYFNNRGYAVLQPNFRGSAGFGDDYLRKGFEQWGLGMQDDLDDGLAWMVQQGYTDPDRVCMVGGSYGGYAALVASFKGADKYRCAVSFAGVANLDGLVEQWRRFMNGRLASARVQPGKSRDENSPLKQVDKIAMPLLLTHGDVDLSVMIEQGTEFVAALEKAGKPYRYIQQANGDHHLSLQKHRLEFFSAMDEFLGEHLGTKQPDDSAKSSGR